MCIPPYISDALVQHYRTIGDQNALTQQLQSNQNAQKAAQEASRISHHKTELSTNTSAKKIFSLMTQSLKEQASRLSSFFKKTSLLDPSIKR